MRASMAMLVAGVALTAACYDGFVEVRFEPPPIPEEANVEVVAHRIVIYAEASGPISCEDLSFDEIPLNVLETTQVFEGEKAPGVKLEITGIPRKGKKLFFAEALLDTGASVAAGCAEHGEITGPTTIDIEAFRRTNLAFESRLVERGADGGQINVVEAKVVSLFGVPQSDEPVKWRLLGASSEGLFESSGNETTNTLGNARITIPDSQRPPSWGPVSLEVRSRWAQSQAPALNDFLDPPVLMGNVTTDSGPAAVARGNDILEVGRLAPNELPSIVILAAEAQQPDGTEPVNAHIFTLGDRRLDKAPLVALGDNTDGQGARTIGKLRSADKDRLVAVWRDTDDSLVWSEIGTGIEKGAPYSDVPVKLGAAGGCGGGAETLLFAQVQNTPLDIEASKFDGEEAPITPPRLTNLGDSPELIEVGCVRDTFNVYRTLFVFAPENAPTVLTPFNPALRVYDPGMQTIFSGTVETGATTAWIGDFSETAEGTMLLGELTLEGPATARYLLQSTLTNNSVAADFQGLDPTPSAVIATAEGDINGDQQTDIVSLLAVGLDQGRVSVLVHVSMSIKDSPLRLRGTMNEPIAAIGPRLRVIDLNGDSIDDIVLGSTDIVRVFLMGPR